MIEVQRNVVYTQARNCRFCLHVGGTAVYFGRRPGWGARLELLTPRRWFRWSWLGLFLLLAGCEVRREPVEARSYVPDARSQAAGWMAYRAVCTPDAPKPAPPKVEPVVVPPKPAAPVKPKVQLNTFGLPITPPAR